MARKVITLYIDDTSIRLLVATRREIRKWAELSLDAGMVKEGVIIEEAAVASRVKELLKTHKVKAKKVVTSLSGRHCLSRLISLPRLPKSLLAEAVRREAEKLLPVPLEQLYLSWQTVPGGGAEIQVFLIAFPRDATDALTKTLRQAGLDPYLIDVKPLALARVVDKATAIVVDVQPTELDIIVIVDRVPQLIRTVSLPGDVLTRQKRITLLREELDRTIKFYNSSHEDKPLDADIPVFISGELVKESETGTTLVGRLKTFAEPLLSPLKYQQALPSSRFMVNVGLVLKKAPLTGKKDSGLVVNLNALPQIYQPKRRSLAEILFVPGIVIALASLVFPIMSIQDVAADTASLRTQIDVATQRFNQAQLQNKAVTELKGKVAALEAAGETFTAALSYFNQQHEIINNDLTTVTTGLSRSIELSSVVHSSTEVTVSGIASDETFILGYAEKLRASDRFDQVIMSTIEKAGDGMRFKITLIK